MASDEKRAKIMIGTDTDPYFNLAVEETLLETACENQIVLFLWQNEHTVVIGRNQNAYTECHLAALQRDGGTLARRPSGGGAVYHDLGNLNFTFVAPKSIYDLARQQRVILGMVKKLGLNAEISGRNDITISGRKFSGNAFLHRQHASLHHGTVLVATDAAKIARYLSPSRVKLAGKGVASVQARVVNLAELVPGVTVNGVKEAFYKTFAEVYFDFCEQKTPEKITVADLPAEQIEALAARNRTPEYNFGDNVHYSASFVTAFPWGQADVRAEITAGVITQIRLYTDALDTEITENTQRALVGQSLLAPVPPTLAGNAAVSDIFRKLYDFGDGDLC